MKNKYLSGLVATAVGLFMIIGSTSADAYCGRGGCYWRGAHYNYYHNGRYYNHYYNGRYYGNCVWVPRHWANGNWYPAHKRCW